MGVDVRRARSADEGEALALAAAHRFSWLRGYRRVGIDLVEADTSAALRSVLHADAPGAVLAVSGGAVVGVVGARPSPAEAERFGVRIARVGPLVTAPGADRHALAPALYRALREEGGADLLVAEVDTDDLAGLAGSVAAGFVPVDTTITYVSDAEQGPANLHRPHDLTLTGHVPPEVPGVTAEDVEALAATAARTVRHDHWHADPRLDPAAASSLYADWVHHAFTGAWADLVVVARRGSAVVGFACWKRWEVLEEHGVAALGRSLAIGLVPEGRGAGSAITGFACSTRPFGHRFVEYATSVRNIAVNRLVARQGNLELDRSVHVLHAWA